MMISARSSTPPPAPPPKEKYLWAKAVDANGDEIYSVAKVDRDDTDFFPNLTVRHSFSDQLVGRFALTRSINRPEFNQIVPRRVEETDGSDISYEIGNPDLKPTLSNNLDLGRSAQMLGIHRNTLVYRQKRIQHELDLDPVNRITDVLLAYVLLEQ